MPYSYQRRHNLPKCPGIYRLQERALSGWVDQYVGQSINVRDRWNREGDRRHQHLYLWRRSQQTMRLLVEPCWRINLDYREAWAIQRHKPRLNKLRPNPKRYWSPLVCIENVWRNRLGLIGMAILLRLTLA